MKTNIQITPDAYIAVHHLEHHFDSPLPPIPPPESKFSRESIEATLRGNWVQVCVVDKSVGYRTPDKPI